MSRILTIFGRPSSSNTQKVLWMLREIGQPFDLKLASARMGHGSQHLCTSTGAKPFGVVDTDEYKKICPTRAIPCLVDGDLAVWESHTIVRYLAQKYKPELHLVDAGGMAQCAPWMDFVLGANFNMGVNHDMIDQMARTPAEKRDYDLVANCSTIYAEKMQLFEERLASTPFVAGESFTIADIPIGCELTRWSCSLEGWARDARRDMAPPPPVPPSLPNLRAFFERLQKRPAFRDGCFEYEREHHGLQPTGEKVVRLFDYAVKPPE